jgi:hypothetical protein
VIARGEDGVDRAERDARRDRGRRDDRRGAGAPEQPCRDRREAEEADQDGPARQCVDPDDKKQQADQGSREPPLMGPEAVSAA